MAAVEVLPAAPAACDASIPIAETLQALNMGPQVEVPSVPENQHTISSNGEHGQALDANARAYCASNAYCTSVYYCGGYNAPSSGWVDEQVGSIGYDPGRIFPVYGEDGSIMYYTSGYAYFQQCQQPSFCQQPPAAFLPAPVPGGHAYGPQAYPFPGPVYQTPVSQGVHYYSPPSFNSKREFSKPGFRKNGGGSNTMLPKYGYHGVLSPPLNAPYTWGGPARTTNYHGREGHIFHERARPLPTRELVHDASGGPQANIPQPIPGSAAKHSQSVKQEPPRTFSTPEPCPKGSQFLPKPGPNNLGRRVNGTSGVKFEKGRPVGPCILGSENVKQDCNNIQQAQVKVNGNHNPEPTDNLNDASQRHQPTVPCNMTEQSECVVTYPIKPEHYNKESFQTSYNQAKFFIIKSYSEDDVHKSIKYGVWSSTPNGNRRLDGAYREAQTSSHQRCPVYLLFSVNTSGQFCGVAEMVGSLDYNKSMDFWLQGKWSGCFPVKWHIVKDVPNSQFRHIILANNENKPVTHSRDTQEVKLEQGCEMLAIFKSFPLKTSILDDFQFYDDRQKFLEEQKLRQRVPSQALKTSDQKSSQDKMCESCKEATKGEDKENGKPGEFQEVASDIPSTHNDKTSNVNFDIVSSKVLTEQNEDSSLTNDKRSNSKSDSVRDDSGTRNVNYKRALMENGKGLANVVGKPIAV